MDLTTLTIKQSHEGLKKKEFSSVELTKAYLENIKKSDKDLNAFLSVTEDLAMSEAEEADQKIASGNFGELTGIPCAIKDAILVSSPTNFEPESRKLNLRKANSKLVGDKGIKCTAGSKILENYIAPYDATVIKKLKEQGSVILGKTNTDEFTMGSSTENSAFGVTKNPYDKTRVAGGSSGGSAAAVAANEACYALGSDTGGSIRQPASFCGVVGLCPTYGAVSRFGLIAHASSFDQIGPLAKNVEDAKIIFKAISGKDKMDATSADYIYEDSEVNFKGLKIGIPKDYFFPTYRGSSQSGTQGIEPEVEKIIRGAIKKAEEAGAKINEMSLPSSEYALACYYILGSSEISANL
ncbi:MAG: amidase, partial [bacterium]